LPDIGSGSDNVGNQQMSYNDDRAILSHIVFLTIALKVFGVFLFKKHNLLFFPWSKSVKHYFFQAHL
jgi:hypothetical protein